MLAGRQQMGHGRKGEARKKVETGQKISSEVYFFRLSIKKFYS